MHAPNNSANRTNLWESMMDEIPGACKQLLCGDFKMVEHRLDKSNLVVGG